MKRRQSPAKSQQSATKNQFRIIAGTHRGRKLSFPATQGLRPTPDRVRETLFNWLNNGIAHARCLDLFAGSGALGLESLSRGAESCDFIEANAQAIESIKNHLMLLQSNGKTYQGLLPEAISNLPSNNYDIVFIDPPYAQAELINTCLHQLITRKQLNNDACIYIEHSSSDAMPQLPDGLTSHRQKKFGQVQSHLLHYVAK